MKEARKIVMSFFALAVAAVLIFFAIACGGESNGGGGGETGGNDVPENVQSLEVLNPRPTNDDLYFPGDTLNVSQVIIRITFDDGSTKTVSAGRTEGMTVSPTEFKAGDKTVTVSYGGKSTSFDVNVISSELSEVAVDLGVTPTTYASGTAIDLSGITVTAKYGTEYSREVDDWVIVDKEKTPEVVYDDPSALELDDGDYTFVVRYGGVDSASFDISVFNGYVVEAENIKDKWILSDGKVVENPDFTEPADGESYMERITTTGTNAGTLEDGIAPGSVRKSTEPASGGAYLGEVKKGAVFAFHVWSDVDRKAEVILRASSGQIEIAPNSGWSPTKMADMQFNQVFSVTYAPAGGEASPVNIDDDVILKGGSTDNPAGDMLLWVNWMDVTFGEVDLKHGDNVFTFTVISNLTHASSPNGPGGSCAANVDRLEVRFLDEADA